MSEMNTARVREIEQEAKHSAIDPEVPELIAALKEMKSLAFQMLPMCIGECECRLCKLRERYEGLNDA